MTEPNWVQIGSVLAMQERLVMLFGGESGIRNQELLESALARPKSVFHYEPESPLERLAASLAHGLVKNHPFIDGNKRVAFAAACLFLAKNGRWLTVSEAEAALAMIDLASSRIEEEGFAAWLTDRCVGL